MKDVRDCKWRVLMLIGDLGIGGAQEVVRTLVGQLGRLDVMCVVCSFKEGPLRAEIERLGVRVEVIRGRRYSVFALPYFIADVVRIRRELVAIVDRHRINVIQTHVLGSMDFVALTLRMSRGLLVFWTIHNVRFELRAEQLPRWRWLLGIKRGIHRTLYRIAVRWADGVIVVSEDVRDAVIRYLGCQREKVTTIQNCVDVERHQVPVCRERIRGELGLDAEGRVMAVVGTFKTQKGHCYLIDAMPSVIQRCPDVQVLLVGDGDLREELRARVESLQLMAHVRFLGYRKDVSELLAACDCFVLPSLYEGMSMALVEAMARGLPVIATNVSGTNEVVVDGESGVLVRPGNSAELSKAIIRVLTDPLLGKAMGATGRERVERYFSAERQAAAHLELYRKRWKV